MRVVLGDSLVTRVAVKFRCQCNIPDREVWPNVALMSSPPQHAFQEFATDSAVTPTGRVARQKLDHGSISGRNHSSLRVCLNGDTPRVPPPSGGPSQMGPEVVWGRSETGCLNPGTAGSDQSKCRPFGRAFRTTESGRQRSGSPSEGR